jgi:hypothetical protein
MKKLYLLILFTIVASGAFAQNSSCAQAVRLAQSVYDQGRLHELEDIINKALNNSGAPCEQAEQVSLLKLLTLTYIYLEEPEKADATMLKLLQTDHYFQINPAVDPAEFVALYKTFRTNVIYRLGVRLGGAYTGPNVKDTNPVVNGEASYKGRFSFLVGATAEIPLDRFEKFTLNPEIYFTQRSYEVEVIAENVGVFTGIKRISSFAIPVAVQYKLFDQKKKFNPYVLGGFWPELILEGRMTSSTIRTGNESIIEQSVDIKEQLKTLSISTQIGTGVKVRAAGGYLTAEIRYLFGLNTINTNVYNNQSLIWDYHWADGINRLNSVQITLGYVQNFFKPKKLGVKK